MHNIKVVEQLGYTPKEAKVYVTALSLGEAHISDIAEKAGLPRSSAQMIVDKLHKDGLMNFYVMHRYKYWVAENPERLLLELKRREETVEEAMPALKKMRQDSRKNYKKPVSGMRDLGPIKFAADSSLQPVLITDGAGSIEYVNLAWEKKFGYTFTEVKGKNPNMLKSGKTPANVYDRMWSILEEHRLFQTDEIVDIAKDGSLHPCITSIFTLSHDGHLFYVQVIEEREVPH